ncbi:DUF4198 domain-containing protein [Ammoniphilus sp. YIM 78166]|uniref:DUF4198 domain-containing protein n=1 Tax=Ammoniphilus sp. YIM 78166 TaxID=1644106 RepID=UPI00106FA98D|nr:DUF4198 domain-containing protein [Ammoniphilus sp. YIM 78166]
MKKLLSSIVLSATILSAAVPALAHDGWSQTNAPIIGVGENSYVELLFGNHSNHHASYRIDSNWNLDNSKVYVTLPNGTKADISSTLFYTGEEIDTPESRLKVNNYHVASFASQMAGAHIISVEGDMVFKHGDVASRTLRSAKSFVAVSDLPSAQRVAHLGGFKRQVTTDRAELVPQFNPAALVSGKEVSVQLLLKGQPVSDAEVSLIQRSNSEGKTFKTDANGIITFTAGPADYYLVRSKIEKAEKSEGQYDKTYYEATMTFHVQNGSYVLPVNGQLQPIVKVEGRQVAGQGLANRNGSLHVSSDFIRQYIDASFTGQGLVPLRSTVEANGASVEWFAPVGGMAPVVSIYK